MQSAPQLLPEGQAESDTGLSQPPEQQNAENLLLHWLWENSVPLPGCPLHSGTPLPVPFPISAIGFPLILLSQHLCSLFPLCLCSPPSLSRQGKNNFLYPNTFSHYFFFCFLIAVYHVSFSLTFSHYSFHLFLDFLVCCQCFSSSFSFLIPHLLSLTLCLHQCHCSIFYEDYSPSRCLGWDC